MSTQRSFSILPVVTGLCIASGLTGGCREIVGPEVSAWEGDLQPVGPAQVQGSVAAVSRSARSETSIQILEAEPGATYRWRLRSGSCEDGGNVIGGPAVYPVLVADASGTAESDAVLSRGLDAEGSYAAWLFRISTIEEEVLAACGDMVRLM